MQTVPATGVAIVCFWIFITVYFILRVGLEKKVPKRVKSIYVALWATYFPVPFILAAWITADFWSMVVLLAWVSLLVLEVKILSRYGRTPSFIRRNRFLLAGIISILAIGAATYIVLQPLPYPKAPLKVDALSLNQTLAQLRATPPYRRSERSGVVSLLSFELVFDPFSMNIEGLDISFLTNADKRLEFAIARHRLMPCSGTTSLPRGEWEEQMMDLAESIETKGLLSLLGLAFDACNFDPEQPGLYRAYLKADPYAGLTPGERVGLTLVVLEADKEVQTPLYQVFFSPQNLSITQVLPRT